MVTSALGALIAALCLAAFKVCDGDTFWHLKLGEVMLDTGRIVRTNTFSSIFPDFPWYNPEWLYDLLLGAVYRSGGWFGVFLLKLILVGLLAGTLFTLLMRRRNEPLLAASLVVVSLSVARFRLTDRPQLLSLVFFCLTLLLVENFRRAGGRAIWFLPPLFALWSNCHPELMIGLCYLAAAVAGEVLSGTPGGSVPRNRLRVLGAVAAACVVASLANPGGYRVLWHPFLNFMEVHQVVLVDEFVPSSFRLIPLFWVVVAATLAAAVLTRGRRHGSDLLTLFGLALLAARFIREVPFFVIAAAPFLQEHLPRLPGQPRPALRRGLAFLPLAVAGGCLVWALRYDRLLPYRWGWGVREESFPVAAVNFLEQEQLPPRLYNGYNDGGYLLFRLYPRLGVFQDSRGSAYPAEFLTRLQAGHTGREFPVLFDQYAISTAVVKQRDAPFLFRPDEWGMVFWDGTFSVLLRRIPANRDLLERLEYRLYLPDSYAVASSDPGVLEGVVREATRNQAQGLRPRASVAADLGVTLGRLRRYREAEEVWRQAVDLAPLDAMNWAYLGRARAGLGDRAGAQAAWDAALRLDPALEKVRRWRADLAEGSTEAEAGRPPRE